MTKLPDEPWVPQSLEAEQGLLGAAIMGMETILAVDGLVAADDFHEPLHAYLWDTLETSARVGKALDVRLLTSMIGPNAVVPVGGITVGKYVARLAAEAAPLMTVKDYANTVRDLADQRRLSDIGKTLSVNGKIDPSQLASEAIDGLDRIASSRSQVTTPAVTMTTAVVRAIDEAALAYQREGALAGCTWGLRDLDYKTLGMHAGDLIILGGRPGMGKTAIGLTIARKTAEAGNRVLVVSLEMGDVALTQRMIADVMHDDGGDPLSYWLIRSGRFNEVEFARIADAGKRLALLPVKIEQRPALTVAQIGALARQEKRKNGLKLLLIDHLHLIKSSDRYRGNRVNEIGEITGSLKVLAKELGIPVVALCQLSRGVEGRDDKRPNLGDLRASGDIEQDADVVIMLYREAYYLERTEPRPGTPEHLAWTDKLAAVSTVLQAIVEKQRQGPIGKVDLFCNIACNAVRDKSYLREPAPITQQELRI